MNRDNNLVYKLIGRFVNFCVLLCLAWNFSILLGLPVTIYWFWELFTLRINQ